jgi:Kef-type K+ transport system membrane component KefB
MQHLQADQFAVMLLSLALLLGVARLLGEIARHFRQPLILGELCAGVLLGPTVFGALAPEWQAFVFPSQGPNALILEGISNLAIVLFLLVAGMEVDLSIVWKQGRPRSRWACSGRLSPFPSGC